MDVVRIRSVASNRDPPKRSFDQEFGCERSFRDSPNHNRTILGEKGSQPCLKRYNGALSNPGATQDPNFQCHRHFQEWTHSSKVKSGKTFTPV